ncbi:type II secretion system protein J [Curtobacterium sp. 9128]|uniref:PulJ/GspJ family protein n=1 Tax=Curtobacterium sp. 9128 TaxID=1793722 RepID=UPI00119E9F17|nr:prepilin-type N-terminal cleavage/methylation domain-containing protein [Curtobacterium sp. 9128]
MIRLLHRIRREDRGVSLAELLVAMSVGVLVLAMAGAFFVSVARASATGTGVDANTRVSTTVMREVQRMLRVASNNPVQSGTDTQYAFQYASATSVRFFAYINLNSAVEVQPVEVQFTLDPTKGTITETKWSGTPTDPTKTYFDFPRSATAALSDTPTSTIILGTNVVPGTLFTYRDAGNNPLTPTAAGLSDADLQAVRSVTFSVTVGEKDLTRLAAADNVTLTSTVSMPNLQFGP